MASTVATCSTPGGGFVRYLPDPPHTFVMFAVRHMLTSTVRGRFDQVEGFVDLDRAASCGHAEITIDMASISTGTPRFDDHLRSVDFFDVARHPRARFTSDDFRFDGQRLSVVAGQLSLLGETHPLSLRASNFNCYQSPQHEVEVCGGDFEATLLRSRWGMRWGLDFGVPDEVRLSISIEALRQS